MNIGKAVEDAEKVVDVLQKVDKIAIKAGYKTTEFWMTIASAVCGILVVMGKITPEQSVATMTGVTTYVGAAIAVIPTIGYIVSRGIAKK